MPLLDNVSRCRNSRIESEGEDGRWEWPRLGFGVRFAKKKKKKPTKNI